MTAAERAKILAVPMIGPKVLSRLEAAGFSRLSDFAGMDAVALYGRIRTATRPVWMAKPHSMAVAALQNLIDAANDETHGKGAPRGLFPNPFEGA
jgi:hypothetical protein